MAKMRRTADDATPRSTKRVRPSKNRRKAIGGRGWLRGGVAIGCGAALTIGAVEGSRWAKRSQMFAISSIEVEGAKRSSSEALQRLSGITEGANLFEVDLDAAGVQVRGHPWVERAEVRLIATDSVRISVVEFEPVALVALGNLYFADRRARLFKRYSPGEKIDLPVITGLVRERVEADDAEQAVLLRWALDLVTGWDAQTHGVLGEVNVDEARGLTVVLVEDGLRVSLGRSDWRGRLAKLEQIRAVLEKKGLRAHRIDLSGRRRADRAVVRLVQNVDPSGDV